MDKIEVVIKIPQKVYEDCIMIPSDIKGWKDEISKAFKNGTVLPERHGRLIDADAFNEELDNLDYDTYNDYSNTFDWIEEAPTIIKADEEKTEEVEND